jgi:hypothetical protein
LKPFSTHRSEQQAERHGFDNARDFKPSQNPLYDFLVLMCGGPLSKNAKVKSGHWSLVTGHWSLVTGHWSVISGQWPVESKFNEPIL